MVQLSLDFLGPALLILLTMAIYVVILIVFVNARRKYRGGVIGQVINLIIATIGFLLVADVALFLVPTYGFTVGHTVNVIFKIIAMVSLAVGGLKLFTK
jgi:hypothetical protein